MAINVFDYKHVPVGPDPMEKLRQSTEFLQQSLAQTEQLRKQRNMQKAQQLLVQRIQADPNFATKLGSNLGVVLPAFTQPEQAGLIKMALQQQEQTAREKERLAAKQNEIATKGVELPAVLLNTMLNKFEPESVGKIMQSMKAPPEQIKAFQEAKRIAQPGAEIFTDEFGTKFIRQPTGAIVPYPKPEKATTPKMYPVETPDPITGKPMVKLYTEEQVKQGIPKYEKPVVEKPEKAPEDKFTETDYRSFGNNLKNDKLVEDSVKQAIEFQKADVYDAIDKQLQADTTIDAGKKAQLVKILRNTQGIGYMFNFMKNLDNSVVRPSELALIKSAALDAGLGANRFDAGLASLRRYWNMQESSLTPEANKVLQAIQSKKKELSFGAALDNVTQKAYQAMKMFGTKRGANVVMANVMDANLAEAAVTAAAQMITDEGSLADIPAPENMPSGDAGPTPTGSMTVPADLLPNASDWSK